jgi:hypothetical protein
MSASRQGVIATVVRVGHPQLVAVAALACLTVGWLLTGHLAWSVTIACAIDWLSSSFLDGAVVRPRGLVLYLGFSLLGFSLVVLTPFAPWVLPFRLAFHLLGFAAAFARRRGVGGHGAALVGFLLTGFAYPLAWARLQLWYGIGWATVLVTAVAFVPFALSYELVRERRAAARLVDALCAVSVAMLTIAFVAHVAPWRIVLLGVGPLLQMLLYKWMRRAH